MPGDESPNLYYNYSYSEPPIFSKISVVPSSNNRTFTRKIECGEKGMIFAVSKSLRMHTSESEEY